MKYYILILFFLNNTFSFAQDIDFIKIVSEQLGLDKSKIKRELFTYKTNPNNQSETIVVIPEISNEDEDGYFFELNSYILIVDSKTGKIKNQYYESSKTNNWTSDAIVLSEIIIDTAPYQISEEKRAFGIRVNYYGMSKANPYSNTTITLFIKSKNKLIKILNNYDIMHYSGEWGTKCAGEFIGEKKILIIASNKTNGYYDILVKNKITTTKNFENENGDCDYEEKRTSQSIRLKYNGEKYKKNVL